jgi:glycosyltransferase involved in cell wall biosynthesis
MATKKPVRVVCSSENTIQGWRWLEPAFSPDEVEFEVHDCSSLSRIETLITRPYFPRYHVAWNSASRARKSNADLLVSFGPRLASFTEHASRFLGSRPYHLVFAFNYTNLPKGIRKSIARSAFRSIDRFTVPSTIERTLYSEYFGLDPSRFDVQLWGIEKPFVPENSPRIIDGDYVCAVGSEGRDYKTLFAAARLTPGIRYVIVTRPYNIPSLPVPENVKLLVNIPSDECWILVNQSRILLVPLRDSEVPCGHVTLVAGMHLRKAMIVTDSAGVADYVRNGGNAVLIPPKDPQALGRAVEALLEDGQLAARLGENGARFARANCSEASTIRYLRGLLHKLELL